MPQATKEILHRTREDRDTSPGQRRRGAKGKNRRLRPSLTLAGKLANMHSMLTLDAWRRWPLHVKIFSQDIWDVWIAHIKKKGVTPLPPWVTVDLDLQKEILMDSNVGVASQSASPEPASRLDPSGVPTKTKKNKKSADDQQRAAKNSKSKGHQFSGGVMNLDLLDRNTGQT